MGFRHAVGRAAYLRTGCRFDAGGQRVRRSMGIQVQRRERTPVRGAYAPARVGSGWCFDALYVAGVENTIADFISRWEPEDIDGNLRAFRPDVAWHRQVLEPTGAGVCLGVLAASSSVCQLRRRLTGLIRQVSGLGPLFGG